MQSYAERIGRKLEEGKSAGDVAAETNTKAAVMLFIGTIQGLVMQSLLSGDIELIRKDSRQCFRDLHARDQPMIPASDASNRE